MSYVNFTHLIFLLRTELPIDILLSGRLSQGLYRLEDPSHSRVFSGVRVSSSQWHSRLGHPATPIVRHVLHRHELPLDSSNKEIVVCDACQQGKSHQLPFISYHYRS
jgi:hypothetical protein